MRDPFSGRTFRASALPLCVESRAIYTPLGELERNRNFTLRVLRLRRGRPSLSVGGRGEGGWTHLRVTKFVYANLDKLQRALVERAFTHICVHTCVYVYTGFMHMHMHEREGVSVKRSCGYQGREGVRHVKRSCRSMKRICDTRALHVIPKASPEKKRY